MELIQNYTSDTESEKEKEEEDRQVKKAKKGSNLPSPPPLVIFSQVSHMSKSKLASMYLSIIWKPSHLQVRQLEQASNKIISQLPMLSENYNWIPLSRDLRRNTGFHISLGDLFYFNSVDQVQLLDKFEKGFRKLDLPKALISKTGVSSINLNKVNNKLAQLLNKEKNCINLPTQTGKITLYPGKLPSVLFLAIPIKQNDSTKQLFNQLSKLRHEMIPEDQMEYDVGWLDNLHISITSGYQKKKALNDEEFNNVKSEIEAIDLGEDLKDIDIKVQDLDVTINDGEIETKKFKLIE
ncbi:unnamed protein product [Candida verbasci]|uniref:U6 snRNA phosphodiesterase n=1 Tax=Candida verbasci TaxID=1227364 RepID=A0A9W4TQM8_9ASCO|nr:unnamed protein product [Candida verbasci]